MLKYPTKKNKLYEYTTIEKQHHLLINIFSSTLGSWITQILP